MKKVCAIFMVLVFLFSVCVPPIYAQTQAQIDGENFLTAVGCVTDVAQHATNAARLENAVKAYSSVSATSNLSTLSVTLKGVGTTVNVVSALNALGKIMNLSKEKDRATSREERFRIGAKMTGIALAEASPYAVAAVWGGPAGMVVGIGIAVVSAMVDDAKKNQEAKREKAYEDAVKKGYESINGILALKGAGQKYYDMGFNLYRKEYNRPQILAQGQNRLPPSANYGAKLYELLVSLREFDKLSKATVKNFPSGAFTYKILSTGYSSITDWYSLVYTHFAMKHDNPDILTIPPSFDGRELFEIGDGAFKNKKNIKEVKFLITASGAYPKFDRIGASAFENSSLTKITAIPGTLRVIGNKAFAGTAITSTGSISNVKIIGAGAYSGCTKLGGVLTLPLTVKVESETFKGTAITGVNLPKATKLEVFEKAFIDCKSLTTVTISNTTKYLDIKENAFANCTALTKISIPSTMERMTIGTNAFKGTKLNDASKKALKKWGYEGPF